MLHGYGMSDTESIAVDYPLTPEEEKMEEVRYWFQKYLEEMSKVKRLEKKVKKLKKKQKKQKNKIEDLEDELYGEDDGLGLENFKNKWEPYNCF